MTPLTEAVETVIARYGAISGNADAFAIARHFGGGGHRMASGMRLEGPLQEAIEKTVEACVQMDGIKAPG